MSEIKFVSLIQSATSSFEGSEKIPLSIFSNNQSISFIPTTQVAKLPGWINYFEISSPIKNASLQPS